MKTWTSFCDGSSALRHFRDQDDIFYLQDYFQTQKREETIRVTDISPHIAQVAFLKRRVNLFSASRKPQFKTLTPLKYSQINTS